MTHLKDTLLKKIAAGEVAMRPRWHFVLTTGLLMTGTLIGTLVTIYLLSFILFILRETGILYAPLFGGRGIVFFVVTSPWLLIGTLEVFLIILSLLVRHYAFSYRQPALFTLIGTVIFVLVTAGAIHYSMIHDKVRTFANEHRVPGLVSLYRDGVGPQPEHMTPGTVSQLTADTFTLTTPHGDVFTVSTTPNTRLPRHPLTTGDSVMVFGVKDTPTNHITADGVRPFTPGKFPPPPRDRRNNE